MLPTSINEEFRPNAEKYLLLSGKQDDEAVVWFDARSILGDIQIAACLDASPDARLPSVYVCFGV
jgi:hypothetical protein